MKNYSIIFQHFDYDSLDFGESTDQGFEVEAQPVDSLEEIIDLINNEGFDENLCWPLKVNKLQGVYLFSDLDWYDRGEGVQENRALHLEGFTDEELNQIFSAVFKFCLSGR